MSVTLYQFELCPFCHKVKAALDVKGIAYRKVEVNPMTKAELPELPAEAPKKVPVIECDGEVVFDSTTIMNYLEQRFSDEFALSPDEGGAARARSDEVEAWVDDTFAMALPTVIYGSWGEALKAAQVTARTSNFGLLHNVGVRAGGPMIMHQVAKRILKKNGKKNGHAWVAESLDRFEEWLGDEDFVGGAAVSMGDVAMHGAVSCVRDFPVFKEIMQRPRMAAWFTRVQALRLERSKLMS
ncbi:MAG TPA: glutathione S-transferase family protein [Polyangiaceae bacterium]|nr:glutathione S-transferase family protein [Polyangiaceae bacterium]